MQSSGPKPEQARGIAIERIALLGFSQGACVTTEPDPQVPFERIRETEAVLSRMGASVDLRRYPGMPHTVYQEELEAARALLCRVAASDTEQQL